jgi:hypothetical protein
VKRLYYAGPAAILAVAFALFSAWAAAGAHTQTVCAVPGDHATIQAAVNDLACETVNLGAGTFYESVTISRTVTLQGHGADLTIVAGKNGDTIFYIHDSGAVTLTGMTMQSHQPGFGSAIRNDGVALVTDCTLSGNSYYVGAGIYNDYRGTMIVSGSTLRDNSSYGYPPGPGMGGGIYNAGAMTVTNSTLSGNTAASVDTHPGGGGGIYNTYAWVSGDLIYGTMTVINSTISGNSAGEGGGIYNDGAGVGVVQVINSVIANSSGGADCSGTITSLGHNIDGDVSCGLTAAGDLPGTDPLLGPLQDNGGPTLTHALLEGSPAIDAGGDTACPATDQRGVHRPQDGDWDGLARCDIGAFELAGGYSVFLPLMER